MLNLITNPGFNEVGGISPAFGYPMIGVAVIVGIALVVALNANGKAFVTAFLFVFFGMLSLLGLIAASGMVSTNNHEEAVIQWLDQGFGIEVDQRATYQLLHGDSLAVDYMGALTRINLVSTGDGDVTVFSVNTGSVLKPTS